MQAWPLRSSPAQKHFFVEQLSTARGDKLAGKLKNRIAAMAKKDIDPGKIQETIWARVQQIVLAAFTG